MSVGDPAPDKIESASCDFGLHSGAATGLTGEIGDFWSPPWAVPNAAVLQSESLLIMSDQIQASHILVATDGKSKEDALALITEIKEKIDGGETFADLAREHSDCPSGSDGGDLGPFSKGMMVPEFDKVSFELEVGDLSDVVETNFGYHLIHRTA